MSRVCSLRGLKHHAVLRSTLIAISELQALQNMVCSTGDASETTVIRGICWTSFALAVVSVAIRTAARLFVFAKSSFGWDDATIAVTLGILAGNMGILETREYRRYFSMAVTY